jgi:hypothetical protein
VSRKVRLDAAAVAGRLRELAPVAVMELVLPAGVPLTGSVIGICGGAPNFGHRRVPIAWHYDEMMSVTVNSWCCALCAVAAFNIVALVLSGVALNRRAPSLPKGAYATRRTLLALCTIYVLGCAFRSVFLVYDVPRICQVDSWLSSVMVGRSVATLAELSFVAQWALLLRENSRAAGSPIGTVSSWALVPLIALAEACSWYSVLTTSNIGHVAEESIWGLTAALVVASLIALWPRCAGGRRPLLAASALAGVVYVAYMFLVDVPMYWSRWLADEAGGRAYLSIAQGVRDVSQHWVVSHRWQDWKSEVVWMSLYFSVAVWISISLVHAPVPETRIPEFG